MPAVSMTVNGKPVSGEVEGRTLLVQFLRDTLRLTGTHVGCDTSQCGACVVHVDGLAVKSCTLFALACEGASVTTIEGLDPQGNHPLQKAWRDVAAPQCGYWQAGQIMQAAALLKQTPSPTDEEIDSAMWGNICRCGTYTRICTAIRQAVKGA